MKIDAATIVPFKKEERSTWGAWHWFWARIFGTRVPTSSDRAHIGNLLVCYRPDLKTVPFNAETFGTDARSVHRLGDLYIFDYGDTPLETITIPYARPPRDISDNTKLLEENIRQYQPQRS